MTVDFHVHSTASDGTLRPSEVAAASRGFMAVALTDHDNCNGADEFAAAGGAGRFAGVELSIEPGGGFDKFHLLGLGVDPANAALKALLARILEGRRARNERIVENFRRKVGLDVTEAAKYAKGGILARPHFARLLTEDGHASDIREAFAKYLLPDSPAETRCYEERWHPPQEEAFAAVHAAGGLCVMAHPKFWRNEWKRTGCDFAAARRELAALRERGLDGLEALYQANTVEENVGFVRLADEVGLLKSAGSDFHGSVKPDIRLGMEVDESYIGPLLERMMQ